MRTTALATFTMVSFVGAALLATSASGASGASTRSITPAFDVVRAGTLDEGEAQNLFEDRLSFCMNERGFRYEPVPPVEVPAEDTHSLLTGVSLDEAEFTSRYGLGVVENTLIVLRGDPVPLAHDPNQQIFESLAYEQQVEYSHALHGTGGVSGCVDIVSSSFEATERIVAADYDRLYDEAIEQPEVTEFLTTWRECMLRSGHAYDSPDAIEAELEAAVSDILNEAVRAFDDGRLTAAEAESKQMSQLIALQQHELDVAAVNLRCGVADGRALLEATIIQLRNAQD